MDGHASFDLSGKIPGLTLAGTDGAATVGQGSGVRMWVTGGSLDHADRRFTGGEAVLSGGFQLRMADRSTTIDHLDLDVASGELRGRIDGQAMPLGTLDTDRLHVTSAAGQHRVYFSVRGDLRLSEAAAARLNTALNTGVFASGDVLMEGDVALGVPLDRRLASDLGIGYEAATDASIQADIQRGAPTDLGLGLI
ncbi:hypothetical protein [Phaeacidiphilus oryzae]|uniref:hypothetical protein n=1 Tax=Phaeacidiphilus oryzae TaxID=348818 RepID=UPI0005699B36|nr:hypothetical protein [Phaeacidiphilus oryzae]